MGKRVFDAAPEPKRYVTFPKSGHSDISADLVVPHITQFIDDTLGRSSHTFTRRDEPLHPSRIQTPASRYP
jgi:hypothetical protein